MENDTIQPTLLPYFGEGFLDDYAGRIISDPYIALVELVANCWDAGARNVRITWPEKTGGRFQIIDDGIGMSKGDFERIWRELNYDRVKNQGLAVIFPGQSSKIKRTAYGRNGKGRHSLFCFANEYWVETWKDEVSSIFRVERSKGDVPYRIEFMSQSQKDGHGTKIYCDINKNYINMIKVQDILGSKFITDPSFLIFLNDHKIDLFDLKDVIAEEFEVEGEGTVEILRIDSKLSGRTSRQHGIAWWVNHRLVGEHSWKGFEGTYLDGRTSQARRFTFIIKADFLIDEIKPDWTDFKESERVNRVRKLVNSYIYQSIQKIMQESRNITKKEVLLDNKSDLKQLSLLSKSQIGKFIDEIQMKCPTIAQEHLSSAVGILAQMELSKTGYKLIQQLSQLPPGDLDTLSLILDEWTLVEAKAVLDELHWRLALIQKMEQLVEDPTTDELHEMQPLFENGLWIFGPEYESREFLSNRTLATIIKKFFGGDVSECEYPRKRPDFVALADRSIGVYSSDDYDSDNEVCGIRKILIVELKKGGSTIRDEERRQAEDYAKIITKSGKIDSNTKIVCYVLGSKIDAESVKLGKQETIEVIPRSYNIVLQQAYARTFNLIRKIKDARKILEESDAEIEDLLKQSELTDNFNTAPVQIESDRI
jgi:hypothetical protein